MNSIAISNFTSLIVQMLVDKKYAELERISMEVRLPAEIIKESIDEYGVTLVMPPAEAFDNLDVIEVDNSNPKRYSVVVDLYSLEEGMSDLSLEMTLIEDGAKFNVEIDGIHVL